MQVDTVVVGYLETNCYLLADESTNTCAIIDPGDNSDRILNKLKDSGRICTKILLTHGHFDHFTAVPEILKEFPGLPIYISVDDVVEGASFGANSQFACPAIPNMRFVEEGDEIPLGSLRIKVWETPGHTNGSLTYEAGNALFTGDTLFAGACGRTDLPRGSIKSMQNSLKKIAEFPSDYLVYPGHGEMTTLETERRTNAFMQYACGRTHETSF